MIQERTILVVFALFWCLGIYLAPFVPHPEFVYSFFSPLCHQFESRSFIVAGHPLAVCGRCTGIYTGFLMGLVICTIHAKIRSAVISPVFLLIVSTVPMFVTVLGEMAHLFPVTTLIRSLTGLWCGIGLALLLYESLITTIHLLIPQTKKHYEFDAK